MPAFVHIDFKGLPLTPSYLLARFAELHDAGASGVVLEWEDCLPLSGSLAGYASAHAYTAAEVQQIVAGAEEMGLSVVPLVQTLGHVEFLLKHESCAALREDALDYGTLCPSHHEAVALVAELLKQVMGFHPNATKVHIGCDEARHIDLGSSNPRPSCCGDAQIDHTLRLPTPPPTRRLAVRTYSPRWACTS